MMSDNIKVDVSIKDAKEVKEMLDKANEVVKKQGKEIDLMKNCYNCNFLIYYDGFACEKWTGTACFYNFLFKHKGCKNWKLRGITW